MAAATASKGVDFLTDFVPNISHHKHPHTRFLGFDFGATTDAPKDPHPLLCVHDSCVVVPLRGGVLARDFLPHLGLTALIEMWQGSKKDYSNRLNPVKHMDLPKNQSDGKCSMLIWLEFHRTRAENIQG